VEYRRFVNTESQFMAIKNLLKALALILVSTLLSACGSNDSDSDISADVYGSYYEGYSRGQSQVCEEIFYAFIGGSGALYSDNRAVTHEECLAAEVVTGYGFEYDLDSETSIDRAKGIGFGDGVGGALDFAFSGDRVLCAGSECITREDVLSSWGP
jgi:hypothetical protein